MELPLPILQGFVQQGVQEIVMKPIPDQVELTPEQKALFPELIELRQQIENLQVNCSKCSTSSKFWNAHLLKQLRMFNENPTQASEKSLREQIYFNTAGQTDGINAADINQISYTYWPAIPGNGDYDDADDGNDGDVAKQISLKYYRIEFSRLSTQSSNGQVFGLMVRSTW